MTSFFDGSEKTCSFVQLFSCENSSDDFTCGTRYTKPIVILLTATLKIRVRGSEMLSVRDLFLERNPYNPLKHM